MKEELKKELGEFLKSKGLDSAEEAVKDLKEITLGGLKIVGKHLAPSIMPFYALVEDKINEYLDKKIDLIDGQEG